MSSNLETAAAVERNEARHEALSARKAKFLAKKMENQLYEVVNIEGKNLGCVCLTDIKKGTLILKEKPQCPDIENEADEMWSKDLFMRLLQNFQTMNPTDREKYLKLYSRHTMEELHKKLDLSGKDPTISDLILKLYGIYETNKFKGGVGIQAARFNHSCTSNAEGNWNEDESTREIRAVKKIKKGEEITICYLSQDAYMKNYKVRQEIIKESWDFDCSCELCQQEKVENCDNFYAKYDQLNQEADKINEDNGQYMIFPESYLRLGNLYKDMYKLVKEKKTSKTFIIFEILQNGFCAVMSGYLHAKDRNDLKNKEVFKKECDVFINAAIPIGEIVLPDKDVRNWKMRKDNLDLWIEQEIAKKVEECKQAGL